MLAIEEPGRGPLALPIWYLYEDGEVLIGMGGESVKARLLRAAGRATLTVQTEEPPYKYLSVEGPVRIDATAARRLRDGQPLPRAGAGRWYADNNPSTPESVVVHLTPELWRTKDFGKLMG